MSQVLGKVTTDSTNETIQFIAVDQKDALLSVVGKMVYFDTIIESDIYRAIGTVTQMRTYNRMAQEMAGTIAKGFYQSDLASDIRSSQFLTQAVFVQRDGDDTWEKYGAYLPTSPSVNAEVKLVDAETVDELNAGDILPSIGYFRGMHIPMPVNTPDFGGGRGAYHSGALGKSGSGKALAIDTPILTPLGWRTMGSLVHGDTVYDETGRMTRVVIAHDIIRDATCYVVTFSNGSTLTADARHLWEVIDPDGNVLVLETAALLDSPAQYRIRLTQPVLGTTGKSESIVEMQQNIINKRTELLPITFMQSTDARQRALIYQTFADTHADHETAAKQVYSATLGSTLLPLIREVAESLGLHAQTLANGDLEVDSTKTHLTITSIEETATVPVRCITVDSPNSLYLAGKNFIVTHNTAGYTLTLCTYMRHEQHAILVVDPQGQWASENGFIISPQRFAESLGREVKVIRIAEEVRLPRNPELMGRIITQMRAWRKMRKMGIENTEIWSNEVAERLVRENLDLDARVVLTTVFGKIAQSKATMKRIYADEKLRDNFRDELFALCDIEPELEEGEEWEPLSQDDKEDIESTWQSILSVFTPLLNMFSSKNLHGEDRHPFAGANGFLTDIFKVRTESSEPAPYVIIDMSPNVKLHAKAALNENDAASNMAALIDRDSVKALILQVLFQEVKKASETAFSAAGGGNLNTQIVFDEAWRYAPSGKAIPEIEELAEMLEGFAFDTRKFGIGWTYILQQPSDLKHGIWTQLTYIYASYGLVGGDVKALEERYSDLSQTAIYKGFISPASTNVYPMMIIGSISPLIFTNSPAFVNMFTSPEEFLEANRRWIDGLTSARQQRRITPSMVDPKSFTGRKPVKAVEKRSYTVAKNYEAAEPQYQADTKTQPEPPTTDKYDPGW